MRRVFQFGWFFSLAAVSLVRAAPAADPNRAAIAQIEPSLAKLTEITGMKPNRKIPADTIDKVKLKKFLEEQMRREMKPESLRIEELSLKKLGLVPANFDLAKSTIDLMTEQAAAFYDYRKKRLFLIEAPAGSQQSSASEEETVIAHELAHALADQHFNLNKYLHRSKTDDSSLARMAVMEGQATWLMYEIEALRMGQSLGKSPGIVDMMSRSTDARSEQYPVLSTTPLYLRASLIFPYMEGLRFQQAIFQKMGKASFEEVFRHPPVNSQQILHPEMYLSGVKSAEVNLPVVSAETKFKAINAGTIGEFDHSVLLEQYVGKQDAASLSPHWRGGGFRLLESKPEKRTLLAYASRWDDKANARKMFDAYRAILAGKWKVLTIEERTENTVTGLGDDGFFFVRLDDTQVSSLEGLKTRQEVLDSLRASLGKLR